MIKFSRSPKIECNQGGTTIYCLFFLFTFIYVYVYIFPLFFLFPFPFLSHSLYLSLSIFIPIPIPIAPSPIPFSSYYPCSLFPFLSIASPLSFSLNNSLFLFLFLFRVHFISPSSSLVIIYLGSEVSERTRYIKGNMNFFVLTSV